MSAVLESNPRGIPKAPFVDDVASFLSGATHESTLNKFQEMISKYRFMESHLLQRQFGLGSKIPELQKSLDLVEYLDKKESQDPTILDFELNDTLWVKAKVPKTEKVNLWLGANVMLEYPVSEAKELLKNKITTAGVSLQQVEEDLEYLKEQITTMEVNMARVYNDDVRLRKEQKK